MDIFSDHCNKILQNTKRLNCDEYTNNIREHSAKIKGKDNGCWHKEMEFLYLLIYLLV